MSDKMTVDQLALRFLSKCADEQFSGVDLWEEPNYMTDEDLAKKVLQKSVKSALPDIDIKAEKIEGGIKIEGFLIKLDKIHLSFRAYHIAIAIFLVVLLVILA